MSHFDSRSLSVLPLVALIAACAPKDTSTKPAGHDSTVAAAAPVAHQMTISATDYAFAAPEQVPAGLMTVHLVYNGSGLHHVAFIKLNDGKTLADIAQAMKSQGPMPMWPTDIGGVNATH